MAHYDLIIKNGTCVAPAAPENANSQLKTEAFNIGILDGKIASTTVTSSDTSTELIDAKGLHVLPGVIDSQVHFREPGLTHKEDLASGTLGAVLGGVTTVFEMPNTNPTTSSKEDLDAKFGLARGRVWSDVSFFIGATADNADQLATLEALPGVCAVKIFMGSSTGPLLVADDLHLERCLSHGHRRMAIHSEDEMRLRERRAMLTERPGGLSSVLMHPEWRDVETAVLATKRILRLSEKTKRPVHVLHITTAEEIPLLRAARKTANASMEVTPQHLYFAAPEAYESLGTLAQMNPPIREARHRDALWDAINDGTVTVIGTDHAPHTREEKAKPYPNTPSGMTGVQTLVPVMLDFVNKNKLSLHRLVELICRNPGRLYGATNKGEIRLGYDADFTLVDLEREQLVTDSMMASKSGWTPYHGVRFKGWPVVTIVRGHQVMRDGATLGTPIGQPVSFRDT